MEGGKRAVGETEGSEGGRILKQHHTLKVDMQLLDRVFIYSVIFYNNVTKAAILKTLIKQVTFISDCPGVPRPRHISVCSQ